MTPPARPVRALVYGDVNLNILDGSAIWVQSMCEALSLAGVDVRVLLKAPVETTRLIDPVQSMASVTVIDPFTSGMAPGRTPLTADEVEEHLLRRVVEGEESAAGAAGADEAVELG